MSNVPINNITDTWNNSGVTFTGIKFNVTDTASNASSLLMDLQVGGSSKFKVDKSGTATFSKYVAFVENIGVTAPPSVGIGNYFGSVGLYSGGTQSAAAFPGSFRITSRNISFSSLDDLFLSYDSANTLAQRNGVNAQTFRLYKTYTDASNYTRLKIGFASGNCEIKPENAGTGAAAVIHISGLPTSNPGPGILWNNAGVVVVGT